MTTAPLIAPLIDRAQFSRFFAGRPGALHFAAHSHHFWPDVTREAQIAAWDDAARGWDGKWEEVFGALVPEVQRGIARRLGLPDPQAIAFAPNTHEFVKRLVSMLPTRPVPRILASDGEFHSFRRQARRWVEAGAVVLETVPCQPLDTFERRFRARVAEGGWSMVFVSQVFFDSGHALEDLSALAAAVPDAETLLVVDGYHGFMALPTDLGPVADRAFYLAGGYKYAMAGEGACFLAVPPGIEARPVDTGWYASFGTLSEAQDGRVPYGPGGYGFLGSTFDPSGLYRLRAVFRWLDGLGVEVADIHDHVLALQGLFLEGLGRIGHPVVSAETLMIDPGRQRRGHFLTFRHPEAAALSARLHEAGIFTDARGDRLRFGFAPYHDGGQVTDLLDRLARLM